MKRTLPALGAIVLAVGLAACDAKVDVKPNAVSKYSTYTDPSTNFSVSYPDGWVSTTTTGKRAAFFSTSGVADAFSSFEPKGERGGKIEVVTQPGDAAFIDQNIAELKSFYTDADAVSAPQQTTVNGMPATLVTHGTELEADGGTFKAERYYVVDGGMVTYLETAVIGNYADYKPIFDEVRKNFQPGRASGTAAGATGDSAAVAGDTTSRAPAPVRDSIVTDPPSSEMKTYSGKTFTMSYPSNFDATSSGDGAIFSGSRADSKVQVNVYPTKGVALAKIVDASKKNYGGRAATAANVGGQSAYVFTLSSGSASGRAYYTVSGDRLYVITTTWFSDQAALYQPAYDKMVASFKAK
jgi:hypothetical protein